jgi:hypothetical protein
VITFKPLREQFSKESYLILDKTVYFAKEYIMLDLQLIYNLLTPIGWKVSKKNIF